jgi:polysaccharide pyruvyl transferase WcaK-like protein
MTGSRIRDAPELALFGEWNTANLGDRAIHRGALAFFEDCGWRTSSYALGSLVPVSPAEARLPAPPDAGAQNAIRAALPPRVAQALRGARQQYRMLRLLPALRHAHAICVGGGALLSGPDMHFAQSLAVLTRTALASGKPLLCLGCSADGAWPPAAMRSIEAFLGACDIVSVRDAASARRIGAMLPLRPVSVFGDFCLAESELRERAADDTRRHVLAVNVGASPQPGGIWQRAYEDALVTLAGGWQRAAARGQGGGVVVFTTGTAQDIAPAQRVAQRLAAQRARLLLPTSFEELNALLRSSELVLASRLHAAILGLAQGAAVIGFSHSAKLQEFLDTVGLAAYGGGRETMARAAALLARGEFAALRRAQREAVLQSPIWAARRRLHGVLESAAHAPRPETRLRPDHAHRPLS